MISRYSRPEMSAIWSEESKFQIWFEIEAHACDAQAELGVRPCQPPKQSEKRAFDIDRINEIVGTKHDVIAFLTTRNEHIGEDARFVHQGMTSSDILDTTLSVQMARASDLLIDGIDRLLAGLKKRAMEHKRTPTIGRSHGIHAEPITFARNLPFMRNLTAVVIDLLRLGVKLLPAQFLGRWYFCILTSVEAHVAAKMGLMVEPVSTQVIPRDRHAMFFAMLEKRKFSRETSNGNSPSATHRSS